MNLPGDIKFDPYEAKELDVEAIKKILPHREPFLLVDRIVELSRDRAVGVKSVRSEEPYFQGHFPGNPVMPGVLIVEAIAQVTGVLLLARPENLGKFGYVASLNNVKFRELVRPGDELRLEVMPVREKKRFISAVGKATVREKVVCEAELLLALG